MGKQAGSLLEMGTQASSLRYSAKDAICEQAGWKPAYPALLQRSNLPNADAGDGERLS